MPGLSSLFSMCFPRTSSDFDNIAAPVTRDAAERERKEVLSMLEDACRALDPPETRAARTLRKDIEHALYMAKASERSSEPARLPSLSRAQEWLTKARFDERINPNASDRLQRALTNLPKEWQRLGIPSEGPEHEALHRLQQELDVARRKTSGRIRAEQLHQFDLTLQKIKERTSEFVAKRAELIKARVEWHQRAEALRFKTGSPTLTRQLFEERRQLDAWSYALAHRK